MRHRTITLACVLALLAAPELAAQTPDAIRLGGRHQIALGLGFMGGWANSARITAGGTTLEAKSALTGSLGYGY